MKIKDTTLLLIWNRNSPSGESFWTFLRVWSKIIVAPSGAKAKIVLSENSLFSRPLRPNWDTFRSSAASSPRVTDKVNPSRIREMANRIFYPELSLVRKNSWLTVSRLVFLTWSNTPLMKRGESSVPNFLANSMASLIETMGGMSIKYNIS